jgi:hypothetical protein
MFEIVVGIDVELLTRLQYDFYYYSLDSHSRIQVFLPLLNEEHVQDAAGRRHRTH